MADTIALHMDDASKKETMLFVAIPGTEPYAELPKTHVKEQLDKGLLKQSALIWSQKHNSWKQAREITQLISGKLPSHPAQARFTPAPQQPTSQPAVPISQKQQTLRPAVAQAKQAAKPVINHNHPVRTTPPQATRKSNPANRPPEDFVVEHTTGTPAWLKGFCFLLVVIICSLLATNWYYVDHALKSNLAEDNSPFKNVGLYAHLGGFFQVGHMVIHIPPSPAVTKDNFLQFITALAAATPDRPGSHTSFETVNLAKGWTADYSISGRQWRRLAKPDLTDEDRRNILLEQLCKGGEKVIPPNNLDATGLLKLNEKVWNEFVSTFVSK